jgi:anti-anti-sigma factor
MEIREGSLLGVPLLAINGEIDHSTAGEFDAAVQRNLRPDKTLFLDVSECPYLDSGGLAVLLSLVRQTRPAGRVGVIGPSSNLIRLLQIVGLASDANFRMFPTREEASAFVAGGVTPDC